MADAGHEPSMEEILSSIKRIIAEDSDAVLSAPRVKRAVAGAAPRAEPVPDILELTDPVAVETTAPFHQSSPEPHPQPETPMPAPAAESKPATVVDAPRAQLASSTTVDASRISLAALSALIVKPEVTGNDTLEGLVRELLKPMLAEWLDARLPDVVERLVAAEIRRIADRG